MGIGVAPRIRAAVGRARTRLANMLTDTEEGVEDRWFPVLCVGSLAALTLVGFLRLLRLAQAWVGITVAVTLSVLSIVLMVWVYWQMQVDARDRTPFVIALLSGLAALCVCVEAFASLTASLWQAGALSASGAVEPSLWTAEKYYVWHLLDGVPLVKIPSSVNWTVPASFSDQWSGALLLAFKVLVLLPILGVAVGAYRLLQSREEETATQYAEDFDQNAVTVPFTPLEYLVELIGALLFQLLIWSVRLLSPLIAIGVILAVISGSSGVKEWISRHLGAGFDVLGLHVSASLVSALIDIAAVAVVVALAAWAFLWRLPISTLNTFDRASFSTSVTGILLRFRIFLLSTLAACACALLLLHVGIADVAPSPRPDQEVGAALRWYSWHLADAIPLLEVPKTLNWSLRFEFQDVWTGLLLVALKINLLALFILPIGLLTRLYLAHAAARRSQPDHPPRPKGLEGRYRL